MKWEITNTSQFRTDDLRAIFKRIVKRVEKYRGKFVRSRYRITVRNSKKKDRTSGRATINGSWMVMTLPPDTSKQNVAWLFEHEHMHNRGDRHKDYTPRLMRESHPANDGFYSYLDDLPLRHKDAEPKPVANVVPLVERRAAKARRALERALKDQKSATARVKKWTAKVKYYQRKELTK